MSRFGASKFRNAIPHTPDRAEWYRGHLPPSSTSTTTASALSTFSSEVKTSREWITTLNAAGDLSYRAYDAKGSGEVVGTAKVGSGGGVGDWDVSSLGGGTTLAVGGLDGSVSVYTLPPPEASPSSPSLLFTLPMTGSPVTHLLFHPTTPSILLASTVASPATIFDPASSAAAVTLTCTEPKGMWSVAWSPDGKMLAGVGKTGNAYIWDPRSSLDPITTKSLSFVQPLKPARITWIGDDKLFLSSFSRSRNRQYSLLSSSDLSTLLTQSLDTSPGLLIPLVDRERKIIYLAGRGDMTLRQVELGGPTGWQETLHSLPYPLASASLALASPTKLAVMQAEIAKVLVPIVDKDGDTLLPLGIRVPRRQLIDYHEDLYPDIPGFTPEQSAREWLNGQDKVPLPISLDPARRGVWEADLAKVSVGTQTSQGGPASDVQKPAAPAAALETPTVSPTPPLPASAPLPPSSTSAPLPAPTAVTPSAAAPSSTSTSNAPLNPNLPPLEGEETYSSTSYKVRIIGHHIGQQLERHRNEGKKSPLMVGLQGPQGCGKTTLCTTLVNFLSSEPRNLKVAVLSLDDLYRTNAGLKEIATKHPNNALLQGRGPPGTHDVQLATTVLSAVQAINESSDRSVDLPIFDKSLCSGEGDRSPETVKNEGPIDVFVLEGWSMGFAPLSEADLKQRYETKQSLTDKSYFLSQPLSSLLELDTYLAEFASAVYPSFSTLVNVEPTSYEYVFQWRLQQEQAMKAKNGGKGMTDEAVRGFVERYMPSYELFKGGVEGREEWKGRGLGLVLGQNREVLEVRRGQKPAPDTSTPATKPADNPPAAAVDTTSASPASSDPTTAVSAPKQTSVTAASAPPKPAASTASAPSKSFSPTYSRKFLSAKSPLNPTYDQLPPFASLHQDSHLLKLTPHLAFFPIQGPGGRLCIHPLAKKGRLALGGEGYLSGGSEIVDWDVEAFETEDGSRRVAIGGEDGVVRIWKVGVEGVKGVSGEPASVVKGKGIDKIAQVAFHPTARDLLVAATNDHTAASLRFFDLGGIGEEVQRVELPVSGIFNVMWSREGDRVAVATKDGRVLVLDPRKSDAIASGKAHDNPRSFQLAWIDSAHLLSVGFSKGSQRRINLYQLPTDAAGEIKMIHSLLIDISPAVLFPIYDSDTSILYVWGKGERAIHAYQVDLGQANEPLAKLPSYNAASGSAQLGVAFLPKRMVDVKKVEVGKALRLTAKTIEEVSFTIPRNRIEFFQDDIFVDTLDIETPRTGAKAWLEGKDGEAARYLQLKPEGLLPLSQAPTPASARKAKFVPARDVMSEEEKKKQEMDAMFAKAKMDESSDEDDGGRGPAKGGVPPPDDDW